MLGHRQFPYIWMFHSFPVTLFICYILLLRNYFIPPSQPTFRNILKLYGKLSAEIIIVFVVLFPEQFRFSFFERSMIIKYLILDGFKSYAYARETISGPLDEPLNGLTGPSEIQVRNFRVVVIRNNCFHVPVFEDGTIRSLKTGKRE